MTRTKIPLADRIISLLAQNHLLTAPQLLENLLTQGTRYNKTSLYRALDRLLTENQICKLNLIGNEIWYELRASHHDHLVCISCRQVEAVGCTSSEFTQTKGYLIQHHHLILFGICPKCQQKNQPQ